MACGSLHYCTRLELRPDALGRMIAAAHGCKCRDIAAARFAAAAAAAELPLRLQQGAPTASCWPEPAALNSAISFTQSLFRVGAP